MNSFTNKFQTERWFINSLCLLLSRKKRCWTHGRLQVSGWWCFDVLCGLCVMLNGPVMEARGWFVPGGINRGLLPFFPGVFC